MFKYIFAIFLLSNANFTVAGSLKPYQTKERDLSLGMGKFVIEVTTNDEQAKISCHGDGFDQNKVKGCKTTLTLLKPATYKIQVSNEENREIGYKISLREM